MNNIERTAGMRAQRRARILEAAVDLAREVGWLGLRQKAIAERAGVAKGSVIHAFVTMDALRTAVMEEAVAQFIPSIVAAGLAAGHSVAREAPAPLREAAAASIV